MEKKRRKEAKGKGEPDAINRQMLGHKIQGKNWAINQRDTRKNKKNPRTKKVLRTNEGSKQKIISEHRQVGNNWG